MAKRKRRTRRDMAAVLRRNIRADGWLPKYDAAMRRVLDSHARDVARAIRAGQSPATWAKRFTKRWARELERAKREMIYDMVIDGYILGDEWVTAELAQAKTVTGIEGKVRQSFENEVLKNTRLRADVEAYINETSRLESEGTAKRFGRYQEIIAEKQLTVVQQANLFMAKGLALNKTRAMLMARTNTIWAYNEGAMQNYAEHGVAVKEWLATIDSATDPVCAAANGEQRKLGERFSTGTFHPPVHANCRCALVPVIDASHVRTVEQETARLEASGVRVN